MALGYDPDFLPGHTVGPPTVSDALSDDIRLTKSGQPVRDCMHFSLAMSASRRFCRWVAWNVDGTTLSTQDRVDFVRDPEYERDAQVGNEAYKNNRLDRGHIARRADLCWGSPDEAKQANDDSFFYSNITPQHKDFNQSDAKGLWGELENAILDSNEVDQRRQSLFGGPVFKDTDLPYRDVLVPRSFWKIVIYVDEGELRVQSFVLTQDDLLVGIESIGLEAFKVYRHPVTEISAWTGVDFPGLTGVTPLDAAESSETRLITSIADVVAPS